MPKHQISSSILANDKIAEDIYCMVITAPLIAHQAKPGNFVHVHVKEYPAQLLRMPFCIFDADKDANTISICYQVVGTGTKQLSLLSIGDTLDVVGPLGNAWSIPQKCDKALLICGGLGAAPMNMLARTLSQNDSSIDIVLGAASLAKIICKDEFTQYSQLNSGCLQISTDDGTYGYHGFCTDLSAQLIKENCYDYIAICGPMSMEKNAVKALDISKAYAQVSLEKLMACGIGACLSCIVKTTAGKKRCCVDGPIFNVDEVLW